MTKKADSSREPAFFAEAGLAAGGVERSFPPVGWVRNGSGLGQHQRIQRLGGDLVVSRAGLGIDGVGQ